MKKVRNYLLLLIIAGLVVALDQWTKSLVRSTLAVGEIWVPWEWMEPYARIIHWNNTGAAFGLFPGGSLIFTIIAFAVTLGILIYYPAIPGDQVVIRLSVALMLGGAVGNLISRLMVGSVTDFISVGSFAVFNVADSSITVGTAILIVAMWLEERKLAREESVQAEPGSDDPDEEQDTD